MGERTFILPSFLRGSMKQMRRSNSNQHRQHGAGVHTMLACAIALTLTGCGQMGDLYQPLPEPTGAEQPTATASSDEDAAAAERGN